MLTVTHTWPVPGLYFVNDSWAILEPGQTRQMVGPRGFVYLVGIHASVSALEYVKAEMEAMAVRPGDRPMAWRVAFAEFIHSHQRRRATSLSLREYEELLRIAGHYNLQPDIRLFHRIHALGCGRFRFKIHGLSEVHRSLHEKKLLVRLKSEPGNLNMTEAAYKAIGWPFPDAYRDSRPVVFINGTDNVEW